MENQYPALKQGHYLKNASISAMHQSVIDEIAKWNHSISHLGAVNESRFFDLLMEIHETIGSFLNTDKENVTILDNSSLNMNIVAMMLKQDASPKRDIIMVADEFPSNALPFYHHGFNVIQVPTTEGKFSLDDFEAKISEDTAAILCSIVQFSTGQYTPAEELSELCEKHNLPLFLNATQSLGVYPLDLKKIKADVVTASCHKWLGAGIGGAILYLSPRFRKNKEYPLAGWCSVAEPFEMKNEKPIPRDDVMALQIGSLPFAVLAGVAQACRHLQGVGLDKVRERILTLSHLLREGLIKRGFSPLGNGASGIVTFSTHQSLEETEALVSEMEKQKIFVNCRRGLIRVSPHFYNSEESIEAFLTFLDKNLVLKT